MDILLTDEEIRVLGCLMEKEMATPEYYPLSLNALTNACNQKSNRAPLTSYDEAIVTNALNGLRKKNLAMESSGGRVPKYAQVFSKEYKLNTGEEAAICILLVRGPQTPGEIRGRTGSLYVFSSLEEVQKAIANLEALGFIKKLEKQPGQKESRYTHLLGGGQNVLFDEIIQPLENSDFLTNEEINRVDELNDEIAILRKELNDLRLEFDSFKAQFG